MRPILHWVVASIPSFLFGVGILWTGQVELALAWARGQVGIVQVSHAYGLKGHSSAYRPLAMALRAYIQQQKA